MPSIAGDDVALAAVEREKNCIFIFTAPVSLLPPGCRVRSYQNVPGWLTGDIWTVLVARVGWDLNLSRSSVDTGVMKWFWFQPSCEGRKWQSEEPTQNQNLFIGILCNKPTQSIAKLWRVNAFPTFAL